MAKERKNDTPVESNGDITPRVMAEIYGTTPYKIRKELRKHAGSMEHAKNSRWVFRPDTDEIAIAHAVLSEKFNK